MSAEKIKAIVLHQPYAALVVAGVKRWETRPSPPNGPMRPDGVRGLPGLGIEPGERVAIVAGARKPEAGLRLSGVGGEWLVDGDRLLDLCNEKVLPLPLGAVLGTVEVVEALPMVDWPQQGRQIVVTSHAGQARALTLHEQSAVRLDDEVLDDQLPLGDWQPGRWAWRLANPEPLAEPVPCKGRQGVFEIEVTW